LWKVLTSVTLKRNQTAFSASYDQMHRNPGHLAIGTAGTGLAAGITNRLEASIHFEAYRQVKTARPEQLSFGQQALGFFGDKTPGSLPASSELMPGSSRVPQLRSPPHHAGDLTGAAGYYNLLPFAGFVESGGAPGLVSIGAKYNLSQENGAAPLGLAVHSYFSIPIRKGIEFLLRHPVGTADLQLGFNGIISKNFGKTAELHWNAGYRHISQPVHASVFRLSDVVPLGLGLVIPRSRRLQWIMESTAEIFVGAHTPNTTFGPEDPVDVTIGFRALVTSRFNVSAGYRRPVNQKGPGQSGFVLNLGLTK
jgi:hypothetical protein